MRALVDAPYRYFAPCPQLAASVERIAAKDLSPRVFGAVLTHLASPALPARELALAVAADLDEIRAAYAFLRCDTEVVGLTCSEFYPHRLLYQFARSTVADWLARPDYAERLLAGYPALSSVVEIHPSRGTCNYSCTMCLWSDKKQLTYARRGLDTAGLMTLTDWERVLRAMRAAGAHTVVFSGGGEVLLNPEIVDILRVVRELGFQSQMYTTGFNLHPQDSALWAEIMQLDQLRLSIHSPCEKTYSRITGLPKRLRALTRIRGHIAHFLTLRTERRGGPRLGIGFVTQPLNYAEIAEMAEFAAALGVDFLHLRKDEVDVTDDLTLEQLEIVRQQLLVVRDNAVRGLYGATAIDISDELVAIANGQEIHRQRVAECMAKFFRPTISPFGIVAPCDLKAEPRFADGKFNLGNVRSQRLHEVTNIMAERFVPDACAQCMPSSRTGNAIYTKLLSDRAIGLALTEQPFLANTDAVAP